MEQENDELHQRIYELEGQNQVLKQQSNQASLLQYEMDKQNLQIKQLTEEVEILRTKEDEVEKLEKIVERFRNKIETMNQSNETVQVFK